MMSYLAMFGETLKYIGCILGILVFFFGRDRLIGLMIRSLKHPITVKIGITAFVFFMIAILNVGLYFITRSQFTKMVVIPETIDNRFATTWFLAFMGGMAAYASIVLARDWWGLMIQRSGKNKTDEFYQRPSEDFKIEGDPRDPACHLVAVKGFDSVEVQLVTHRVEKLGWTRITPIPGYASDGVYPHVVELVRK